MPNNLPDAPQQGDPLSVRGLAELLQSLKRAFEYMECEGGTVQWLAGIPRIVPAGAAAGGDSGGLPEGGEEYQVLQRDSGGNAVWDWVRWP
jgi:hypothetical protein